MRCDIAKLVGTDFEQQRHKGAKVGQPFGGRDIALRCPVVELWTPQRGVPTLSQPKSMVKWLFNLFFLVN